MQLRIYLRYSLARLRNRWRKSLRHWTWAKAVFLVVTIGPLGFGVTHWLISQTFNNLKIDFVCGQVAVVHNSGLRYQSGTVNVMIEFDNEGIPVNLDWTITAQTNVTGEVISGSLSYTIPRGVSILNMTFYLDQWIGNATVGQILSFAKYSALFDVFSDPRIFSQSYSLLFQAHDYRKVNDTSLEMPVVIAYLFYTQTGYYPRLVTTDQAVGAHSCKQAVSPFGFSI